MPTVLAQYTDQDNKLISFDLNIDEVIYEGLERQGLKLPHGCLAGSCGACRIEVTSGSENLKAPSAVEKDTIDFLKTNLANKTGNQEYLNKNIRLSCRAKIQGNISFKAI